MKRFYTSRIAFFFLFPPRSPTTINGHFREDPAQTSEMTNLKLNVVSNVHEYHVQQPASLSVIIGHQAGIN